MSYFSDPTTDLVPGLASYMEDNEVNVDIDVKEPEQQVEEATAAEEVAEEAEAVEADAEANEEQVEMICRNFDELDRMEAHIMQYGVSREFVAWHGAERVAAVCAVSIPSLDAIDSTPNPSSQFSIACQEGIGDSIKRGAKAVWDFIKRVCQTIWNFMKRAYEFVVNFIIGIQRNIGRLRTAYAQRDPDDEKASKIDAKFATYDKLNSLYKTAGATVFAKIKEMQVAFTDIGKNVNDLSSSLSSGSLKNTKSHEVRQKVEAFVKNVDEMNKAVAAGIGIGSEAQSRKVSDCKWDDVPKLLQLAEDILKNAKEMQDLVKKAQMDVKNAETAASKAAQAAAKADKKLAQEASKQAREDVTSMNKIASNLMKVINFQRKIAQQCVKTAAIRISNGSKKKG